jgi:hypothetical protein
VLLVGADYSDRNYRTILAKKNQWRGCKKPREGISRILFSTIIHLGPELLQGSSTLPAYLQEWHPLVSIARNDISLFELAPRRVYLVSLQHYLYILSVALVLTSRWTGVTRYVAIWCPDFPPADLLLDMPAMIPSSR